VETEINASINLVAFSGHQETPMRFHHFLFCFGLPHVFKEFGIGVYPKINLGRASVGASYARSAARQDL